MEVTTDRTAWFETVGLALISVFLYQSGFLLFLFMVPLVMLYRRRGQIHYAVGAIVAFVGIVLFKLGQVSRAGSETFRTLALMDALVPLLLFLGMYALIAPRLRAFPTAGRLGIAAVGIGLVGAPLLAIGMQSGLMASLESQFVSLFQAFQGAGTAPEPDLAERVARIAIETLLSFFIASAAVIIGLNWYVGQRLASRLFADVEGAPSLKLLHLDPRWVWVVIGGAVGVLAELAIGIGVLRYGAWNALFFGLALYGAQGLGILFHLLESKGIGRGGRLFAAIALIVLLFVPGMNVAVMLGIPGLGVAEIWVNFGRLKSAERSEE